MLVRKMGALTLALVLAVSFGAGAEAQKPEETQRQEAREELSPELQERIDTLLVWVSEKLIQAENQFLENREAFEKSAEALGTVRDVYIDYVSLSTGDSPVSKLDTVDGRQLYVHPQTAWTAQQSAQLRESGALGVFSNTDCARIHCNGDYTVYWWEIPYPFIIVGIIHIKNRDGLDSRYILQKELEEGWGTFVCSIP